MSDDPDPCSSSDVPRISIAVTVLDPEWPRAVPAAEVLARRAAAAAVAALGAAVSGAAISGVAISGVTVSGEVARALAARDAEISLVLADDATLRRCNLDYRGIDKPTNVLAFAAVEEVESEGPLLLGDVLLARETLTREAGEQGKRPADHLCHLVAHGVLHLLGQDHQSEGEAKIMERLEVAALDRLGIADPYADSDAAAEAARVRTRVRTREHARGRP
jgi:probable rRNA maturation factor